MEEPDSFFDDPIYLIALAFVNVIPLFFGLMSK